MNYYEILKVSPKSSNAEIKSAYRKLARKIHPDVNEETDETTQEFSKIAKAYEILSNPKERAEYDKKLLQQQYSNSQNADSVFTSQNFHAKRWRQMVYEKRYNDIIDRMIADERRESIALQRVIFPTVALFVSTLFVAILRPAFFTNSAIIGKIIFISLFVVSLIHIISRFRDGFEKYTYFQENIHDSILEETEPESKPFSLFTAISFLVVGILVFFGVGIIIGNYFELNSFSATSKSIFTPNLSLEIVFYPPIITLFVDIMHAVVAKFE